MKLIKELKGGSLSKTQVIKIDNNLFVRKYQFLKKENTVLFDGNRRLENCKFFTIFYLNIHCQ